MSRPATTVLTVVCISAGILTAALVLHGRYTSWEQAARRAERIQETREHERFVATFDSLKEARLYPTAWRSGAFTRTSFDDYREEWTLTISSGDWARRDEASRMDLVARLYTTFRGVRAQAGGDPGCAILFIENEQGEKLASCTPESGVRIHR